MPTQQHAEESTQPLAHPERPARAPLAQEDIDLYLAMLPQWREHQGEHVLIYGGEVHGFFADHLDAMLAELHAVRPRRVPG